MIRRANAFDSRTIQAAVCRGGGVLALESLDLGPPRDDEVLVRIVASGICHTDIDCAESGLADAAVFGHEGAGVVEAVGPAVAGLQPGDHVVMSYQSCGRCDPCRQDHPVDCQHFWGLNFGFERLDGTSAYAGGVRGHFFGQSSFATHTLATARNLVLVDKALSLESLAPLGCGLQTGAGTVMNSFAAAAGQSIAVFGTGTVGLAAIMAARIAGAAPIVAVDRRPKRLRLAKELGATHSIDARTADVAAHVARIAGGGVDYVIEGTGDPALDRTGRALLNPGGQMARLTGGGGARLPEGRVVRGVIQGNAVPQRFIPHLIALWQAGQFPFDRLVTVYGFADINKAIADAKSGKVIKPVLRIGTP